MLRQPFVGIAALAALLFVGPSARGDNVPKTAATTQEAVKATTDALDTKIDAFNSNSEPLEQIIQHIATTYKLRIDMRWDALKKAGIDRKTPVYLTLHAGLPARELLKQVIRAEAMGLTITDPDLLPQRSIRDNGQIVITTRADMFENFVSTRKYPQPNGGAAGIDAVKAAVASDSWATKPNSVGGKIALDGDMIAVTQTDDNQRWMASVAHPAVSP